MLQLQVGREATERRCSPLRTHRPARTILYQLVEEYSHVLEAQWTAEGRVMPGCFWREFEDYLKSGRLGLEKSFLQVRKACPPTLLSFSVTAD